MIGKIVTRGVTVCDMFRRARRYSNSEPSLLYALRTKERRYNAQRATAVQIRLRERYAYKSRSSIESRDFARKAVQEMRRDMAGR